jgi:pimeloyl-ACP methyl ester carboxylesterase
MVLFLILALPSLPAILPAQETVKLEAEDGQPLAGSWYPPQGDARGGVLLLHMYQSSRAAWIPLAPRLAEAGLGVLALDMRGHGASRNDRDGNPVDITREATADPERNPFLKMAVDAHAGLAFLREHAGSGLPLGIVGASVGCSIALQAGVTWPEEVSAIVLMTPGTDYLGVLSEEHAEQWGDRPALLLCSEEEADAGARPLKQKMESARAELRIVPGTRVHGTRMFGKVDSIEPDIIEWLVENLAGARQVAIPLSRAVLLDGQLTPAEAEGANVFAWKLDAEKTTTVRLARNRTKLLAAFDVPERHMRRNEVTIYLDGSGTGPLLPDGNCWKISYNPGRDSGRQVQVFRGHEGKWEEAPDRGVVAFGRTEETARWTAEVALDLETFFGDREGRVVGLALGVTGSGVTGERTWPTGGEVALTPRVWQKAVVAGP